MVTKDAFDKSKFNFTIKRNKNILCIGNSIGNLRSKLEFGFKNDNGSIVKFSSAI
jgi:hypothetical protein